MGRPSGVLGPATAVAEELLELVRGLFLEDAALYGDEVVQATVGWGVVEGTGVAGLRVGGGEDDAIPSPVRVGYSYPCEGCG